MNYIVLDLEWNQSNDTEEANKDLLFEIIEFGAVKLNEKREVIGEFSELVKPVVYKEFHHITQKLVHMTMGDLEKARGFVDVMKDFLQFCGEDAVFCTWGPLDLYEMQRNMHYYQMEPLSDSPIPFFDVQKLFSLYFEDGKSRKSLEGAVDFLEIPKTIPFHRASSDAYYTAKILQCFEDESIFESYSFDLFYAPKTKKQEVKIHFRTYFKYISRVFETKTDALEDKIVCSMRCYKCHRRTKRMIKWFSPNGKHYYAVAKCEKHGLMKGKIRVKKDYLDRLYIIKTMKFITEDEYMSILERQERMAQLRQKKQIINESR